MRSAYYLVRQHKMWKAENAIHMKVPALGKFGNLNCRQGEDTGAGPRLSGIRKFACSIQAAITIVGWKISANRVRYERGMWSCQVSAAQRQMAKLMGGLTGCSRPGPEKDTYAERAMALLDKADGVFSPSTLKFELKPLVDVLRDQDRNAIVDGIQYMLDTRFASQSATSKLELLRSMQAIIRSQPFSGGNAFKTPEPPPQPFAQNHSPIGHAPQSGTGNSAAAGASGKTVSKAESSSFPTQSASSQTVTDTSAPRSQPITSLAGKSDPSILSYMSMQVGNIADLKVDAIVNAANQELIKGEGVCGAIFARAGNELDAACAKLNGCKTGSAKITPGYELPAKHVIHAVGPICRNSQPDDSEREQLASCYRESIRLAVVHGLKSIAFPAISTGIYGYPKQAAAACAFEAVRQALSELPPDQRPRVIFSCFQDPGDTRAGRESEDIGHYRALLKG